MSKSITFGVGLKSNKETNEFLRCLWSRMAVMFGKVAWLYLPARINNTIIVGQADIGKNGALDVWIHYKQRGCLSSIEFRPPENMDIAELNGQLKQCINEAFQYEKFKEKHYAKGYLDKNISFSKRVGKNFAIEGNEVVLKVYGYDKKDCFSLSKVQLLQACHLLTFDTLRYITLKGTLIEEIREKHNFRTSLVDSETDEVIGVMETNKMYQNLEVTDNMAKYIDDYLERSYGYEEHFTNFDKSVQLFAQGVRNEELSRIVMGSPEPYAEQAIVNYMSAMEVITLNDKEPEKCEHCGQMKYSIVRRVTDLAEKISEGLGVIVKCYYGDRSGYVHNGFLLSSNSYLGRSIPVMSISKNSREGMIKQVSAVPNKLKEMVKECIEWHKANIGR